MHHRVRVSQPGDFVLELELTAFELHESRVIHGRVVQRILDLTLKGPMLALELG